MLIATFLASFAFLFAPPAASQQRSEFRLVVGASNGVSSLSRDQAAQYFLKKRSAWPDGQAVLPVDQGAESPVRRAFSRSVLNKDIDGVRSYWQTLVFSGRALPPQVKASDAAVLAFVEANPGAIGYVSAETTLVPGVKEVRVN